MKITQGFKRFFAVAIFTVCFANPILSADCALVRRPSSNPFVMTLCTVVGVYGLYQYGMDFSQGLYAALFGRQQSLEKKKTILESNIKEIGIVVAKLKDDLTNKRKEKFDLLDKLYESIDVAITDTIDTATIKESCSEIIANKRSIVKNKQKLYWPGLYSLCTSLKFFMNTRFRCFDSDDAVVFDWLKLEDENLLSDDLNKSKPDRLTRIDDFCTRAKKRLDFYASYLNGINKALFIAKPFE